MVFKTKPTKVSFDREGYLREFAKKGNKVLKRTGDSLLRKMRKNLLALKEYPSEWRYEMRTRLQNKLDLETEGFIRRAIGLPDLDNDEFARVRASILEHGTGSRGEENGYAIWHWQGVPGLNDDVTGFNISNKKSFPLPDEFNKDPGHWFSDACTLIEEEFNDAVDTMMAEIDPMKFLKFK